MRGRGVVLAVAVAIAAAPASACLNEVGTTRHGERVFLHEHSIDDVRRARPGRRSADAGTSA